MEQQVPDHLIPIVKDVVHQLVTGNYGGLVADGRAGEWSSDALAETIAALEQHEGATLVDLPAAAFADPSRGAVPLGNGERWGVDIRLWTANGPSDYTIMLNASR